jgi:hypothetical protein
MFMATENACSVLLLDFLTSSRYCPIKWNTEASSSHPVLKLELHHKSLIEKIGKLLLLLLLL